MRVLLSVILPACNSEKTLGEAIESVLSQSMPDWELIVVDDNSSDGTSDIAEAYSKRDDRIKVIHNRTNLGPAGARNRAIDMAEGEYIGFLDSDDTFHENFAERMTAAAMAWDADVVWCGHLSYSGSGGAGVPVENGVVKNRPLDAKQAAECFFNDTPGIGSLWNKIYARRIFAAPHGLRLNPRRVRAEDWEFNLFVFKSLSRLVVIEDFLYNYCRRSDNSVMSTFRKQDYDLMWRSVHLLETLNKELGFGYTYRDIINVNGTSIIDVVYRSIKTLPYREMSAIFRDERFWTYLDNLDTDRLALTYWLLAGMLRHRLERTAYMLVRIKARLLD